MREYAYVVKALISDWRGITVMICKPINYLTLAVSIFM